MSSRSRAGRGCRAGRAFRSPPGATRSAGEPRAVQPAGRGQRPGRRDAGQERTVLPLLAERVFGLHGYTTALTFIVAFGLTKAATNFFAGTLADRYGRKPVLVAGWLVAVPVPLLLIWAPTWGWVVSANVLLGVSQGLTWSITVIMKIDLAGPERRGLAMGLNEASGYLAVAATALATGYLAAAYGLRPAPFLLGLAFAALGLSTTLVSETREHAHAEVARHLVRTDGRRPGLPAALSTGQVAVLTSVRDRALSAVSQAGLVNNLNDGLAWGLFPLLFAAAHLSVARIGVLAALYPAVWGLGQLVTGAASDRLGRKWLIAAGMWLQAAALALFAAVSSFWPWAAAAVLLGAGTALVYPTLLAAVGDVAHPAWRPGRSGSTGSGGTPGSPSGRWSPGFSPTPTGCGPRSPSSRPLPPRPVWWSRSGCTRPCRPHRQQGHRFAAEQDRGRRGRGRSPNSRPPGTTASATCQATVRPRAGSGGVIGGRPGAVRRRPVSAAGTGGAGRAPGPRRWDREPVSRGVGPEQLEGGGLA